MLKFLAPTFAARAPMLLTLIPELRDQGWPAANWLAAGVADGHAWALQDFVVGSVLDGPTAQTTPAVVAAIEAQAGLGHLVRRVLPSADHGAGVERLAIERCGEIAEAVAHWSPEGRRLVATLLPWVDEIGDVPRDDLVHGDVGPGNIVFTRSQGAVFIDTENLGFGSRTTDLAALYVRAVQFANTASIAHLAEAGARAGRWPLFTASVAIAMLGNIAWLITNAPERVGARIAAYQSAWPATADPYPSP